jgi:hypothetical protein
MAGQRFHYAHLLICVIHREVGCDLHTFTCAAEGCTAPRISRGLLLVTDHEQTIHRYRVIFE